VKKRDPIAIFLLLGLAFLPAWGQSGQPQPPSTTVDGTGLEVQDQPPSQGSQGDKAQSQQPAQEKTITPEEGKELFRSVDEILKYASQNTALPIKQDVKRKLVRRDEVEAFVQKNMKDDKDAKRLERSEVVLKKFGLLPRDFDLKTFLVALLREQVAGYYDPKTRTVNLLNWVDAEQQKPVLAHELTHALQDQSFGLEKWMRTVDDKDGDPSPKDIESDEDLSARQAVVEGQAMAVLLDYTLAPTGQSLVDAPQIVAALKQGMLVGGPDTPTFQKAPIFIKETLTFSYRYGLDFTIALLRAGGKELAFAGAFKVPPRTTREIMEPDTYLSHEKIEPVKMLDFAHDFADYQAFDIGAIGEFDVDVLVQQYAGRDEADALYPQWRGGYYFAGRAKKNKTGPIGILYVSKWANASKAAEFAAVYAKSLAQRYKKVQALDTNGKPMTDAPPADSWRTLRGRHAWMTEEGPVVIDVRSDSILISETMDDETTKRVSDDFWGGAKGN